MRITRGTEEEINTPAGTGVKRWKCTLDGCEFHVGMILRGDVTTYAGDVCRTCPVYALGIWVFELYDDVERVGDEGQYFKGRDLAVSMNARGAGFWW